MKQNIKKRCCLYYKFTQCFPPSVGFKHVLIFVASSNKVCVSFPLSTGLQNFSLPYMLLFKAVVICKKIEKQSLQRKTVCFSRGMRVRLAREISSGSTFQPEFIQCSNRKLFDYSPQRGDRGIYTVNSSHLALQSMSSFRMFSVR